MRKRILLIAALALLSSMVMSTAQASTNPIPNLVMFARYFVFSDLIQHYGVGFQQNAPAVIGDQQLTTSPPLPNPDAQPDQLDQGGGVVVNDAPGGLRDGKPAPRQIVRMRREQLRP